MAFIKPSRPQYDPKDDLRLVGQFLMVCSGVFDLGPDERSKYGKSRLAIEFTAHKPGHPAVHGKKTASVVLASVYKDPKTGRESQLLALARMMGVVSPEKGFDPDVFMDKWYMVQTELYEGKAYPKILMPASQPAANGQQSSKPAELPPPGQDEEHGGGVPY